MAAMCAALSALLWFTAADAKLRGLGHLRKEPLARGVVAAPLGTVEGLVGHALLHRAAGGAAAAAPEGVDALCQPWKGIPYGGCPKMGKPNLCNLIPGFCNGGVHKRCEMPQLPEYKPGSAAWEAWAAELNTSGIAVAPGTNLTVEELIAYRPAQTQLDACEICGMIYSAQKCFVGGVDLPSSEACEKHIGGCFCAWTDGISVTEADHRILDGHHRWAATRLLVNGSSGLISAKQQGALAAVVVPIFAYNASMDALVALADKAGINHTKCGAFAPNNSAEERRRLMETWDEFLPEF